MLLVENQWRYNCIAGKKLDNSWYESHDDYTMHFFFFFFFFLEKNYGLCLMYIETVPETEFQLKM